LTQPFNEFNEKGEKAVTVLARQLDNTPYKIEVIFAPT
jgi:hypothetical protein